MYYLQWMEVLPFTEHWIMYYLQWIEVTTGLYTNNCRCPKSHRVQTLECSSAGEPKRCLYALLRPVTEPSCQFFSSENSIFKPAMAGLKIEFSEEKKLTGMVCLPVTSEAGARWPRFGLVVVAATNRRHNKVQMIRPLGSNHLDVIAAIASCGNRT
jgi:hypothetical protein